MAQHLITTQGPRLLPPSGSAIPSGMVVSYGVEANSPPLLVAANRKEEESPVFQAPGSITPRILSVEA